MMADPPPESGTMTPEQNAGPAVDSDSLKFLAGGGAMGEEIRARDWSRTPLGPPETWPASLRTMLSLCLASNFPLCFSWGPERVQIYNDGYWPLCGSKHPHSLGQDYRECWASAWPVIGPGFERCMATGETSFLRDARMFLDRNGYLEETFFTFSFSPIRDEAGTVAGVFHPVTETTHLVLAERRLGMLRDVAGRTSDARTIEEALRLTAAALAEHSLDLPFVLLYRTVAGGAYAELQRSAGLGSGDPGAPERIELQANAPGWPLAEAARSGRWLRVDGLEERFGRLACGPYPEPPQTALVYPLWLTGVEQPAAFLVAGVSTRRALDTAYQSFYDMLSVTVSTAVSNAHAYEEEKRRAEALAELDRAKTAFFSNVSHEFRTPLTLMLGPLEELLQRPECDLPAEERQSLRVVHRNGLRLLKLVNTLLDFSRLEAGRTQVSFEPVDFSAMTAELASQFRSTVERAGLRLRVECPALPEPVYVDREMWEKVVLNLVSNAFKFTFDGEIAVETRARDTHVELTVRDTGTGIPQEQLAQVFERFHRVKGAVGRSYEGSGIGLSLVQELVRLHGGSIRAESEVGRGTAFTVEIPRGARHLPPERINAVRSLASTSVRAEAFVEEAARWLPDGGLPAGDVAPPATVAPRPEADPAVERRPRVLLVDDNADMREYVRRLLEGRYQVSVAADGAQALAAARRELPDLVLTDVMMPNLDGFGLLRELRSNPVTRTLPVIMLSARAGEEARVEGLEAGADDYLVKPFPAQELLARVEGHLKLARLRQEVERSAGREEALREADHRKDEFLAMLGHELRNPLGSMSNAIELLRRGSNDPGVVERSVGVLTRQIRQATRLVRDLQDVSRITQRKLHLETDLIPLQAVLRDALETSEPLISAREHTLTVSLPEELLWVEVDIARCTQVFTNLLSNAVKFTDPGGQIWVHAAMEGSDAVVRVRDSGVGIAPDVLPAIFDMFVQPARTLGQSKDGLGIGLSLARGLVQMHQGTLTAQSDGVGQGSEFVVRLPLASHAVRILDPPE
jgi:signal transduction histidine kinase